MSSVHPTPHPSFKFIRQQHIAALNLDIQEYEHIKTGAQHLHIAADNPENVFLVALRTVPEDSTGVAHILEHTALCGSEKYPVRDPFFMMIRRSLNSFMNAMTSSDWTAYPFASQNRKDFDNLLDVYLDAVFFSRLHPLDFAQEGHRMEFEEAENPQSDLVYKGVVYNEMKGAMSSATSILWHTLSKYVFPTSTYHHNSGGEPECIPDLSYEQLLAFYKTHYHPSNAVFMTFGDIPAAKLQQRFEDQALNRFERLNKTIAVTNEKRYLAPLRVEEAYACDEENLKGKTHIVMSWLLGDSTDLQATLEAELLSAVLMENSASPLQHALETTELGNSPSPICGLEHSQKELLFTVGLEGSEIEHTHAVENLILNTLTQVAEQGIAQEKIEACLHLLELQQREITGDSYPYGLQLMMSVLNSATYRGDPIALLNLEPVLENLREKIKDPNFIKQLASKLLLENSHRVTLTLRPDNRLSKKRQQAEKNQLAKIKENLTADKQQDIIQQTKALLERQQKIDDESLLPKVTLADIPKEFSIPEQQQDADSKTPLIYFPTGTNGLVYQQMVMPLPSLNEQERLLLPLYSNLLTELGIGKKDYMAVQDWQSSVCGSIKAMSSVRSQLDSVQKASGFFVLSSKGLHRNYQGMSELMQETLEHARFDEHSRIGELIGQARARAEMAIPGSGHSLAMTAASSGTSALAHYHHSAAGLLAIKHLKQLDECLQDEKQLADYSQQLQSLHQKIIAMPRQYLLISDENSLVNFRKDLAQKINAPASSAPKINELFSLQAVQQQLQQFWQCNVQVHYCAKAFPTVSSNHPDSAALTVLGGFLRNGFLHTAIREKGGAYGGGASHDNNTGAFRFFSYRDPRFTETLNDFDRSIDWLITNKHDAQQLEESILGVISSIDKPSSPAGEAKLTFHNNLHGRTAEKRRGFRNSVLKVSLEDLKRVGETYLSKDKASTAVIGGQSSAELGREQKLEIVVL